MQLQRPTFGGNRTGWLRAAGALESGAAQQPLPSTGGASSASSRIFPIAQNGGGGGFWRPRAVRGV